MKKLRLSGYTDMQITPAVIGVMLRSVTLLICVLLLQGCAGRYFREAESPPPSLRHDLAAWPVDEYWTGVIFNGNKIGFSHILLSRGENIDEFIINSEAVLAFHFLGMHKDVSLISRDHVSRDLTLRRFEYDYELDGNVMHQRGSISNGTLQVEIETGGGKENRSIALDQPVYPASVINMIPVSRGMKIGDRFSYQVYDGETRQVTPVRQVIEAFEESELFSGPAFKVSTRMHDHEVTTWISERAEPLLEISMNGIFIAGLEDEDTAKRFLTAAAVNKDETLLNFSLVKADRTVDLPQDVVSMEVELLGVAKFPPAEGGLRQQCETLHKSTSCKIETILNGASRAEDQAVSAEIGKYLGSTIAVPSRHPLITELALDITRDETKRNGQIGALLAWIQRHIRRESVDVFTAVDVIERKKAECQGHSYLFAAFARSLGIPARLVNGLVYSAEHNGFLYHTWVEAWLGDRWLAVDPTFGQLEADATHIKLLEGENPADLMPLLSLLGRIEARILSVNYRPGVGPR